MPALDDRLDALAHVDAAFELDRFGAAFLEKSAGISQRLFFAHLVREKRHVADHQRALAPARHQAGVIDHLVHGYGQGVGTALHDAAQRIADQKHFDARIVENPRKRIVVGRQASDLFAALLHFKHMRHSDLVAHD